MPRYGSHPYMKLRNWNLPPDDPHSLQYWEKARALESERGKEMLRHWLAKKNASERSLKSREQPIRNQSNFQ